MNQLPYLLPWVRVALLISSIRAMTFDVATWPTAKTVLRRRSRCGVASRGRAGGTDARRQPPAGCAWLSPSLTPSA